MQEGNFSVDIKGLLPEHSVEVPDHVQLGMCAVEDTLHGVLHICNTRSVTLSLIAFHINNAVDVLKY